MWYLFAGVYELKTSEHIDKFITRDDDYCYTDENGIDRCAPLDMLYKSKEEAEHYLNHQDITRTETLPFLTWEEFLKEGEISFKDYEDYNVYLFLSKSKENINLFCLNLKHQDKYYKATEDNFYKAYDECVKLFKGE